MSVGSAASAQEALWIDQIYCGNNVDVLREFVPDASIDLTVTSPPYDHLRNYNGYDFDFDGIAGELWRVTKPGGRSCVGCWGCDDKWERDGDEFPAGVTVYGDWV